MKRLFILVLTTVLFATQQIFAVPAYPNPINYTLPDGSQITIQLRGNEWINWAETLDGFTLLRNSEGFFEYATLNEQGDLILSGVRVYDMPRQASGNQDFLHTLEKGLMFSEYQIETKLQLRRIKDEFLQESVENGLRQVSGSVRIPVILVGFADRPFTRSANDFHMLFNQLNYTVGGATGSVRDYFRDVSYGALDLQADIFGPFTLPNPISFYDNNCGGGDSRNMARLAIDSAFHIGGANFADYAVNGVVNTVHIIFAGYCQAAGAPACQSIWSHAWAFWPPRNYNGVSISRFSTSPELRGNTGTNLGTIGTIVHELGHSLLDWPDFYSVNRGAGTGNCVDLWTWCLMAAGCWNGPFGMSGATPARPSAWAVVDAGWVPEITLLTPQDVTIPNPLQTGVVYRINTTTPNEYFLLENRQRVGWDAFIPTGGMLIYHIDRASTAALNDWARNEVLTHCSRRRLYIKQAGCATVNGCAGGNRTSDAWPRAGFTEFTDNSTPNARSWAGTNTNRPITGITHNTSARTISFAFMGGAANVATVPYFEGFESTTDAVLPSSWTHSAGENTWRTVASNVEGIETAVPPRTGNRQMARSWRHSRNNAWVFSEPIQLDAGTTYTVSFWYRAPGWQNPDNPSHIEFDNFKVQIAQSMTLTGSGANAQMLGATTIVTVNNQRYSNWTQATIQFTPTTSGQYFLGFHDMTPTGQGLVITIDDISITEQAPDPIHSISLNQTGTHTFTNAAFGYEAQTPLSVTVTNTGNQPTGTLNIALSGTNVSSFTFSRTTVPSIAPAGTSDFTVVPNTGLAAGTHTATVTVTGENEISESFDVSFTVNRAAGDAVDIPMLASKTHNRITVNAVASPAGGQTIEYAIHTTNNAIPASLIWQSNTTFSELSPNTGYFVHARSAQNANFYAGTPSVSELITTLAVPVYSIALSQTDTYMFTGTIYGYEAQTPLNVIITNTGNQPTGALSINLIGANASNFTLSRTTVPSIAVASTDNFTVVPNIGLDVDTYTASVVVSGENGILESFNVSFTVNVGGHTGISEFEQDAAPRVFPNPVFDGKFVVEVPNNFEGTIIQIYDFSGQLALTRTIDSPKTEIDISHLPNGTYIVKIGHFSVIIIKQ